MNSCVFKTDFVCGLIYCDGSIYCYAWITTYNKYMLTSTEWMLSNVVSEMIFTYLSNITIISTFILIIKQYPTSDIDC